VSRFDNGYLRFVPIYTDLVRFSNLVIRVTVSDCIVRCCHWPESLICELFRILAGPFCTMNLGDMGAEVIKVEKPGM